MLTAHYTQNQPVNKIPQPFTAEIIRGGEQQSVKLHLNNPGDRFEWAVNQDVRQGPKLVLCLMATKFYNVQRKDSQATVKLMAELTSCSRNTLFRHLKTLKAAGLITPAGRTSWGAVKYRVNIGPTPVPGEEEEVEVQEPTEVEPVKDGTRGVAYWRHVYTNGLPLDGMPLWVAEVLFEEDRKDLGRNAAFTPVKNLLKTKIPPYQNRYGGGIKTSTGGVSKPVHKQKRETEKGTRSSQKRQPRTADSTTNPINLKDWENICADLRDKPNGNGWN